MTSSEKILAGIIEEAKTKAAEINNDAANNSEKILSDGKTAAENQAEEIILAAKKKADSIMNSGRSAAALIKRDAALQKRRHLIEKAFSEVTQSINNYSDSEYFDFLLKLIEKGKLDGNGVLFLNKRDLARDKADFINKIANFNLTLNDTPVDINGGFILKYNDILINGELAALIHEKREILVDSLNKTLFAN